MVDNAKAAFDELADEHGFLTCNQVGVLLDQLEPGHQPPWNSAESASKLESILQDWDTDANGVIAWDEFQSIHAFAKSEAREDKELIDEAYRVFLDSTTNEITAASLQRAMQKFGEQLTRGEAERLLGSLAGADSCNKAGFEAFYRSMQASFE